MKVIALVNKMAELSKELKYLHEKTLSTLEEVENVSLEVARIDNNDDELLKYMAKLYRDVPEKFYEGDMEFITKFFDEMNTYILKIYGRKKS
jgi:hypothetical protein